MPCHHWPIWGNAEPGRRYGGLQCFFGRFEDQDNDFRKPDSAPSELARVGSRFHSSLCEGTHSSRSSGHWVIGSAGHFFNSISHRTTGHFTFDILGSGPRLWYAAHPGSDHPVIGPSGHFFKSISHRTTGHFTFDILGGNFCYLSFQKGEAPHSRKERPVVGYALIISPQTRAR